MHPFPFPSIPGLSRHSTHLSAPAPAAAKKPRKPRAAAKATSSTKPKPSAPAAATREPDSSDEEQDIELEKQEQQCVDEVGPSSSPAVSCEEEEADSDVWSNSEDECE